MHRREPASGESGSPGDPSGLQSKHDRGHGGYRSTERKIYLGFALLLLCLAVVAIVAHRAVVHLREDTQWVEHTHRVLDQLEALASDLAQAQNELRGYAITADLADLRVYLSMAGALDGDVTAVRDLTSDNPEQQQRVAAVERAVGTYLGYARAVVQTRQNQGFDAARAVILRNEGTRLATELRALISQMETAEHRLLVEREDRARRSADLTDAVIVGGSVLAVLCVVLASIAVRRDLTGRRRAEAQLNRFFTLSLDFLAIAGADGYFKRVSSGVTEILGWTPDEFTTRPYIDLVHPEDREATLGEVRRQLELGEKVLHFENRYQHKDGSWRVLAWRSVPGEDGMMYGVARDMTESHRVEQEILRLNETLRQRAEEVEAVNQELETFSYSVSHDLRAPLRHIQGYVEMLERELEGRIGGDALRYLSIIDASAQRMSALIDQLLAFAQMGRAAMADTVVDVAELVSEVRQELEFTARGRDIRWTIAAIPLVRGDRAMLRQVFANVLGNSIKYTRPRVVAEITIGHAGDEGGRVIVFVRDNGVGFDMKHGDKLFGVFQRLHRASEFEGSGIGLANVHRIITRHGGRIWGESKPNEGATFYFTLPRA